MRTPVFVRATTRAVAARAAAGGPRGVRRAVPVGGAAAGGRRLRRRHPVRAPTTRQPARARRDRRGISRARRRAGAAAVGAARPGVRRPLPRRPARRGCRRRSVHRYEGASHLSPRTPRSTRDASRAGSDDLDRAEPRPAPQAAPTAAGVPRDGRCGPRSRRAPATPRRAVVEVGRRDARLLGPARPGGSRELAAGLAAAGVAPGRPGRAARPARRADLTAAVYALLARRRGHRRRRQGARAAPGMRRALRGAASTTSSATAAGLARGRGDAAARAARIAAGPVAPGRCRPSRAPH